MHLLSRLDDKTLLMLIGGAITLFNHLADRKTDKKLDHITLTVNSNLAAQAQKLEAAIQELAQARTALALSEHKISDILAKGSKP